MRAQELPLVITSLKQLGLVRKNMQEKTVTCPGSLIDHCEGTVQMLQGSSTVMKELSGLSWHQKLNIYISMLKKISQLISCHNQYIFG